MKVFFTASLTGKKHYLDNYKKIVDLLKKEGAEVISDHIFLKERSEVERESLEERQEYQKKFRQWINESDLVLAEISYPSTGVGYQITYALEKGKPVIALHVESKVPIALEGGSPNKLLVSPYSLDELDEIIPDLTEEAKNQMDVRFNFFISPKIVTYLDWISKNKKTPRAVFIRRLIEEHMKKNKEYKA